MAISDAYQNTLKKRALQRFIQEQGRAPTIVELQDLIRREHRDFSSVDRVGITGFEIQKPQYRDISSVEVENTNRKASFDDMFTINNRLDDLVQLLEDSFRGFQSTARRTHRLLRQLEFRVDNLLLLNGEIDVFIHGIEETFDTQEIIDIDRTSASVESGYCTLGRSGYTEVPLDDVRISASVTSDKGIIGSQISQDINLLKQDDGSYWEQLVYTKTRQGRVSMILEMEMPEPLYVGDLRIMGSGVSVNQKTTITVFYSLDGQTFTALEPAEQIFKTDENVFNLGVDGVRKIQLLVSKTASDNVTVSANQYVYVFSLDSIKIFSDKYTDIKESTLIAGPYLVTDEEGNPVRFTKATLEACAITPEDTSINFSLSKDGINWVPVSFRDESLAIVSFADGTKAGTEYFIDPALGIEVLVESAPGITEVDFATEALLNMGIHADFADLVPLRGITLKRNIFTLDQQNIYGAPRGWFFDTQYRTTVQVDAPEGRYIDVGPTGITVNGRLETGLVHLKQGVSTIATDDNNWAELPEGLMTVDEIIDADPFYPYNHKYLIEGYNFPSGFSGDRVYTGVNQYFGALLKYVAPEEFSASESGFDIYTVEEADGNLYFKVKVDKTDASWRDEHFDVDWVVQSDDSSDIFVRAILATSNSEQSPILEHFSVRVI